MDDYYAERRPRFNPAILWRWFKELVGEGRWSFPGFRVPDFEAAVEPEWPRDDSSEIARVVNRLRPFYAWPDKLAVVYSDAYRSAFVLAYLLAAGAVFLALLPAAAGWFGGAHHAGEIVCYLAELILILTILAITLRGRRRRWHERWNDYRLAAELIRHLRLMVPLGGGRPYPQVSAHHATYGNPGSTWAAWYVRAVERHLGLPSANLSTGQLNQSLGHLIELLRGQADYHHDNFTRCHRIERRLHLTGLWLLGSTLLACVLHLLPAQIGSFVLPNWLPRVLTFLCGFLPALGAALVGINNQGEFRRIAKRSESMVEQLLQLLKSANELHAQLNNPLRTENKQESASVADIATRSAQLMVNEVLDWRIVSLGQPLEIHGG